MQETIGIKKEKLKHKIAKKPVFKSKSKEGIKERKEIPVKVKTEKSERQQKVKAIFVPPAIVGHEVESGKTDFPRFGHKQDTKISASEEKMKSTAMEIKVKREVKEHLKGSVEELVSEPQKLKNLSREIKEPEVVIVKTDFEITPPTFTPETHPPAKPPEIKPMQFMPSTPKTDFDTAIPEIKLPAPIPLTVPKLSVEELPEIKTRNYFDNEVSSRVISEILLEVEKGKVAVIEKRKVEASEAGLGVSFEDFEEIKKDEKIWIPVAGLVSQSPNILVVTGVEEMGFAVIKGLLQLELEDRGHEPNLKPIKVPEEDKEELKEISEIDDKTVYNRLISLEGYFDDWINFLKKEVSISEELKKALSKTTLRYVVFENKLPLNLKRKSPKANFEFVNKRTEESIKAIRSLGVPLNLKEINLTLYSPESVDLRELDIPIANDGILLEFAKIFAKILQIKKSNKEMENRNKGKMDTIWYDLFDRRDSAIAFLLREYNKPDSKIRKILKFPADKLSNESKEHFVIKQLVIKNLLKRKIGGEKITPEKKEDEGADQRWEKIDIDRVKCTKEIEIEREILNEKGEVVKRPDIKVEVQGKNIWIEVETCKTLDDPLEFVYEKLAKIPDISPNDPEAPDELWIIFPYRKYFLYGAKQIEDKIRNFFMEWFKKTQKFKPRIFFADLYDEKLFELRLMESY